VHVDERITKLLAGQYGLVTRSQALKRGIPVHRIDHLVRTGAWKPIHPGIYQLAGSPDTWRQRLLAACLAAGPDALASHRSAARLWELPVLSPSIELTIPNHRCVRVEGVTVHRAKALDRRDRRLVTRIPVASVARTIIDLATVLETDDLENVLDEALSRRLVNANYLSRRLRAVGIRGRKGAGRLARLLTERLDGRTASESQFETRLAQALRSAGLPPPIPQLRIQLPNGRFARLDFAYPHALLAIEADSYRYHSAFSDWSRDRVRHNELIALGWRVLPVTFAHLRADPGAVADQVARCLLWRHV
jgi:very-short-patch-repair endonuclease